MKTTKTVPVTICDLCGEESSIQACRKCKKDVCSNCREDFSVYSWRGDGGQTPSFSGNYCVTCSPSIVAAIVELGFTLRPVHIPKAEEAKAEHKSQ
jgi:hypothetical protein